MYLIGKTPRPNPRRKYNYHSTDPSKLPKFNQPEDGKKQLLLKPMGDSPDRRPAYQGSNRIRQLVQVSDIVVYDLDALLKIWVVQLVENALERKSDYVEVILYQQGKEGFDVLDSGNGIDEKDFDNEYLKCMKKRQRNEIYKNRSIGYKGEALDSLSRAANLMIITKKFQDQKAVAVQFNHDRGVASKQHVVCRRLGSQGTIV